MMFRRLTNKLFDVNQKEVNRLSKIVDEINSLGHKTEKLKDSDFPKKTDEFKKRIEGGEKIENLLPEAFALIREASRRTLGMYPYDVQLMAAISLFEGKVAEQKTGEGKTLSAVLPLYLRALAGRGAHLVTVNDYLARRDAGWNAPLFHYMGLSVGVIVNELKSYVYDPEFVDSSHGDERLSHLKPVERKAAYSVDITYGTNNEFGFDYLRDNMKRSLKEKVQRGHYYSIVDEVDSILIDEARTPLIISGADTEPTDKYQKFAKLVTKLSPDTDFTIDEKTKSASLTEEGIKHVEKILGVDNLYEKEFDTIHHLENALRARSLYLNDRDYVVKDNEVIIVDEFTGRLMTGRRWSDGLHQAIEAKEGVVVQQESKTYATISFQNYFRLYEHLSGMTGTAATEANEFKEIYGLDVVVIPTNKLIERKDHSDMVYKTLDAKYKAITQEVAERSSAGQPVLVGTTSIEKNEVISTYLRRKKIKHNVLNAKNHESEALTIAEAGKPGSVTVATNMAGRGVDIVLGGGKPERPKGVSEEKWKSSKQMSDWKKLHDKVLEAGGLHVIGTERHDSRRIDNQLRGRSGRQGDPGSTRFYLSMEDDLMRIFGGEQMQGLMNRFNLPDDQPIENRLITRAIEQAQIKVEGHNFDIRKDVVEYDDVANQQREIVYKLRDKILAAKSVREDVEEVLERQLDDMLSASVDFDTDKFDSEKAVRNLMEIVPLDDKSRQGLKARLEKANSDTDRLELLEKVLTSVYEQREKQVGKEVMREIEKFSYLGAIDHHWIEHIDYISDLRDNVRLRGYAQKDPKVEYKNEAFRAFEGLMGKIESELAGRLFRTQIAQRDGGLPLQEMRTNVDTLDSTGLFGDADIAAKVGQAAFNSGARNQATNLRSQTSGAQKKVGRNDPCPCGSGLKYKKCGLIGAPEHKG